MKTLFIICFSVLIISVCQSQYQAGTVIALDGTVKSGTIFAPNARAYHEKIVFKDSKDEKDYTYLPGDIKAFVVQQPTLRVYESLTVDSTGAHFFLKEFSDERIKYYYYIYKKKGNKEERGEYLVEVYIVNDSILHIDYNRQDELLRDMDDESWVEGGIIKSSGDTLLGMIYTKFANDDKKITFLNTKTRTQQKLELIELNGYFVKNLAFKKVYLDKQKEKDHMVRVVTGVSESMQLYADYKEKSQGMGSPVGPSFGPFSLTYAPTYLSVDYFVKKEGSEDVLKLSTWRATTAKDKIAEIRAFFGDYPRLATAVILGSISQEKAIVNLYNLYKSL